MNIQDRKKTITAEELRIRYNLDGLDKDRKAIQLSKNEINKTNDVLEKFVEKTTEDIKEIKDQVDGNITTWFFSGIPTDSNQPANEWTTEDEKINHIGDLYYDKDTGYCYRWTLDSESNVFSWIKLSDADITEALAVANSAKDTADSKRRVFVTQPAPPYDIGDIWIKNDEDLYRCRTIRVKEDVYNPTDWILATNYTDDTVALQTKGELDQFKTNVSENYVLNSTLETTVNSINGRVEEVYTYTESVETLANNNKNDISNVVKDVSDVVTNVSDLKITTGEISSEVSSTNTRVDNLTGNVETISENLSEISQTVDTISSKIEKTIVISDTKTGIGQIQLENAYEGRLYRLSLKGQLSLLYPTNSNNLYGFSQMISDDFVVSDSQYISSGVPKQDILYPSDNLFGRSFVLKVDDTEYKLNLDYLNYMNSTTYDEFEIKEGIARVIRRVGINSSGNFYKLPKEIIEDKGQLEIRVNKDSIIKMDSIENPIIEAEYLLENQYTDEFATKVDLKSEITQTQDQISLKVSKGEVISSINQSAEEVQINANKIKLEGYTTINNGFSVDLEGNVNANSGNVGGWIIDTNGLNNGVVKLNSDGSSTIYTVADLIIIRGYIMGTAGFSLPPQMIKHYDLNGDGVVNTLDYVILQNLIGISMNNQ